MTVLDTLNFVAFNPLQNNNPIAVRRRKLIAKIDEQIQLAANKDYTPTQHKWITDADGNQKKVWRSILASVCVTLNLDTSSKDDTQQSQRIYSTS